MAGGVAADSPVGLGIIGYGIMGERLLTSALTGPFDGAPPVRIAGVWDPSPAALERLAEAAPQVERIESARALIAASDCVYVASPPASHLEHARAALWAGRALFLEKPLAVDLADARAFVAQAREAGLRVGVNYPFASSPAAEALTRWREEGIVGTLERIEIEVAFAAWPRPWQHLAAAWLDRRLQGGFTREVASHFLFLAMRVAGPLRLGPASVVYPVDGASERAVAAELFCGEVPVLLRGSVGETDRPDTNRFTLVGSAGSVRLRDWSIAERLVDGRWREAPDARPQEEARPLTLARQLRKVAAMTRGEPHDLATLEEALAVQETVEAILEAGPKAV